MPRRWPESGALGEITAQSTALSGGIVRLSGANRYATAVAISTSVWEPADVTVVYLATGDGYADALAMGASTFGLGPLLAHHKGLFAGRDKRRTRAPATVLHRDRRRHGHGQRHRGEPGRPAHRPGSLPLP